MLQAGFKKSFLVTYPCPARKPRLEGLTLSLNTTISMLWHLWSDEAETGEHSSTTHHWSASRSDAPVICWSLMDMGLKKARLERSEWSVATCVLVTVLVHCYAPRCGPRLTKNNPISKIYGQSKRNGNWPTFSLVAILDSGPLGPLINFGSRDSIILQDRVTKLTQLTSPNQAGEYALQCCWGCTSAVK